MRWRIRSQLLLPLLLLLLGVLGLSVWMAFAAANHAACQAMFLGGVTRRFPTLKFAFKEGGVGWAVSLYCSLYERWHKRNLKTLDNVNPKNIDLELYRNLCREYGDKFTKGRLDGPLMLSELEGGGGGAEFLWREAELLVGVVARPKKQARPDAGALLGDVAVGERERSVCWHRQFLIALGDGERGASSRRVFVKRRRERVNRAVLGGALVAAAARRAPRGNARAPRHPGDRLARLWRLDRIADANRFESRRRSRISRSARAGI